MHLKGEGTTLVLIEDLTAEIKNTAGTQKHLWRCYKYTHSGGAVLELWSIEVRGWHVAIKPTKEARKCILVLILTVSASVE